MSSQGLQQGLRRIAADLAGLSGWRRAAAFFGCGSLLTLALPPLGLFPLLFLILPVTLWLTRGFRTAGGAAIDGWWFGFGFHLFGLYWITFALFTDLARWWFVIPFAAIALPAALALFTALGFWLLARLYRWGAEPVLAFTAVWALTEFARGHLFTGFPWNLIAGTWTATIPVLQTASVLGAYGLGLVTVLAASLAARAADPNTTRPLMLLAAGPLACLLLALGGVVRLNTAVMDQPPPLMVRVVQPNIPQTEKWDVEKRETHLARLLRMTAAPTAANQPADIAIWPETAVTLAPAPWDILARGLPPRTTLIAGSFRVSYDPTGAPRISNSLEVVEATGQVLGGYDKFHLVPFGEYMPLRDLLPIDAIAAGAIDLHPGPGPRTLRIPGIPDFSPLICYEVIFPGGVVGADRPAWMVNVTNDAWYGHTAGPHQHLAQAQMRAVEEGLPLYRAANTGISAVIDAFGRRRASLPLGDQGVIDQPLLAAVATAPPFTQLRHTPLFVILIPIFGFFLAGRVR